ncbi:MAG: periplasmic heavy metal sensor [Candidatus Margulisbacteria bacterium]|nr:periplasmic heavy metal sensor [Candidatus Margulisiibacteriota bacterium]MBU1021858.1 periplasmic heavy metal sensor [Candidatus Margulisiibacteriota bacterium]MBU1729017.1 periplasmic heavy metal sensor [Candidatus Margulisiibacteriota bacterium]MBU1954430.1 periplasmic heavy metal sensor [Candidatus Margulisiibacteriota bacterium]
MRNKNWLVLILVGILIVSFASGALAWDGQKKGKPDGKQMFEKLVKTLDLTEEQKAAFIAAEEQMKDKSTALREKNKELRDKVKQEMEADQPDVALIKKCIRAAGENTIQLQLLRAEHMLKLQKTLTPEQREKFKELNKKREKKMSQSMHEFGRHSSQL